MLWVRLLQNLWWLLCLLWLLLIKLYWLLFRTKMSMFRSMFLMFRFLLLLWRLRCINLCRKYSSILTQDIPYIYKHWILRINAFSTFFGLLHVFICCYCNRYCILSLLNCFTMLRSGKIFCNYLFPSFNISWNMYGSKIIGKWILKYCLRFLLNIFWRHMWYVDHFKSTGMFSFLIFYTSIN